MIRKLEKKNRNTFVVLHLKQSLFYFSVGYVSRSGGLSNELNNIIARNTDGVCEGVAIGGDRFVII